VLIVFGVIMGSGGFWMLLHKIMERWDWKTKLLIGSAHDRISYLCESYIKKGYITKDELVNLQNNLIVPYKKLGGNGGVKALVTIVMQLPVRDHLLYTKEES